MKKIEWIFERYRNGQKMAQGVRVHAECYTEAVTTAARLFHNDPRETFTLKEAYVLREARLLNV